MFIFDFLSFHRNPASQSTRIREPTSVTSCKLIRIDYREGRLNRESNDLQISIDPRIRALANNTGFRYGVRA